MKKIFLSIVFLVGIQGFAQKTITIYNLSSTNFEAQINTKSTTASGYPKLKSILSQTAGLKVPPNTTYIMQCTPASLTRFPFLSPTSTPQISIWQRFLNANSYASISSAAASSAYGNTQIFDFMKTQVIDYPNNSRGGGNLRPNDPIWPSYLFNSINGTGQGAVTIDQDPPGTLGGTPEVTIVITD